jgi:hypothetical protein
MTRQPELDHQVVVAAESGDQLELMKASRGVCARAISAGPSDRDLAALLNRLLDINEKINTLEERKRHESGDKCPHCKGTGIRTGRDHSSSGSTDNGLSGV